MQSFCIRGGKPYGHIIEADRSTRSWDMPRGYAAFYDSDFFHNYIFTYTKFIDGHFILYERGHMGNEHLFGVEDYDSAEEADRRLYERVLDFLAGYKIIEDRTRYSKYSNTAGLK